MRIVKVSKTFDAALDELLSFGASRFGRRVADEKLDDVLATVRNVLAVRPQMGTFEPRLRLYRYEIRRVPFVVLFDYDDRELRLYTVVHARSDIPNTDLSEIAW